MTVLEVVVNCNFTDPAFGEERRDIVLQQGRVTALGTISIPILNRDVHAQFMPIGLMRKLGGAVRSTAKRAVPEVTLRVGTRVGTLRLPISKSIN